MKSIEIAKTPTFNVEQTLECGQVFRYGKTERGYVVFSLDHYADISDCGDSYILESDDTEYFSNYFDFDTDYGFIQQKVQDKGMVSAAIEFGRGIHILKQNPVEVIFSFLVSQNNHIPRIKGIIERICQGLGEDKGGYFAFPSLDKLAGAGERFFADIGAGYRAAYLDRTAKFLLDVQVEEWGKLDTENLRRQLLSLHGIGRKVADCILLFGFSRCDVFPVDTWIQKIYQCEYPNATADKMSELLERRYGCYAGFVQQWLYYFKRESERRHLNAVLC